MIYFTSDTHFGHKNVIEYCNRPWQDVYVMDHALIDRWNRVVRRGDTVYHLGDVSFHPDDGTIEKIFSQLNGRRILVPGNHDREGKAKQRAVYGCFDEVTDLLIEFKYRGLLFTLCHFPLEQWNRNHHGSFHLHGHTHGNSRQVPCRMDVGVDAVGYQPICIDECIETLRKQ
jgi:calcineurin-like phosphoesterase family protein